MATLTDAKARNLSPDSKPVAHGGVTGLVLHPASSRGRGKWVLRYVSPVTKKRRNAGLGSYPEIGIAEAAKLGQLMREQLAQGLDPLEERDKASAVMSVPPFKQAAEIVHASLEPGWKNKKHSQQWINTLMQYAVPVIGELPINQIEPRHIADVLRPIWLEKAETASRLKQRLHAIMAWAWAHGFCQANPVDVVEHLLPQQPSKTVRTEHQPAMPWSAIPEFVAENLDIRSRYDSTRPLLLFLILTAARSGEVRAMTWEEVNFAEKVWVIPASRMKAKILHRVPLSSLAMQILERQVGLHESLVFPSVRDRVVLSDMALTAFLRRVTAPSSTPGRVATAHGFRSSFRDWASEHGYPRDLAERALAHTLSNKVEAAYHRTDLLEQRRPMMEAWATFIASPSEDVGS